MICAYLRFKFSNVYKHGSQGIDNNFVCCFKKLLLNDCIGCVGCSMKDTKCKICKMTDLCCLTFFSFLSIKDMAILKKKSQHGWWWWSFAVISLNSPSAHSESTASGRHWRGDKHRVVIWQTLNIPCLIMFSYKSSCFLNRLLRIKRKLINNKNNKFQRVLKHTKCTK